VSRNLRGHTFVANIFNKYILFIKILAFLIFLCKESINNEINNDEIDTKVNKDINLPKKDTDAHKASANSALRCFASRG